MTWWSGVSPKGDRKARNEFDRSIPRQAVARPQLSNPFRGDRRIVNAPTLSSRYRPSAHRPREAPTGFDTAVDDGRPDREM